MECVYQVVHLFVCFWFCVCVYCVCLLDGVCVGVYVYVWVCKHLFVLTFVC